MKRTGRFKTNSTVRNTSGGWASRWPGVGTGRYWKRKLAKARRKYAKNVLTHGRGKEPVAIESEVNYRTW